MAPNENRSFVGRAVSNSGCAALAGCLWLVAALWLLPLIWIGVGYGYNASEWLSLLPYPAQKDEVLPWVGRAIPLLLFVSATLFLAAFARGRWSHSDKH